jgi:hypothetical protein
MPIVYEQHHAIILKRTTKIHDIISPPSKIWKEVMIIRWARLKHKFLDGGNMREDAMK